MVLLATAAALALISAFGELFVDPTFHVSETLIGMFIAAVLALCGISVAQGINFTRRK